MKVSDFGEFGRYHEAGDWVVCFSLFGAAMGVLFGYSLFGAWWGPFAGFFAGMLMGVGSMIIGWMIFGLAVGAFYLLVAAVGLVGLYLFRVKKE